MWLIGSDISQRAVEAAEANLRYANFDRLLEHGMFKADEASAKIKSPLVYQSHWPQSLPVDQLLTDGQESRERQLSLFDDKSTQLYCSLY